MSLPSTLAKVIGELPEDFVTKSESLPNMLKKAGVKQEELDFAGMELPAGKVTRTDLISAENARKDTFEFTTSSKKMYEAHTDAPNDTYTEWLVKFKDPNYARYAAPHFKKEGVNLLAHSRGNAVEDMTEWGVPGFEGKTARVVEEIQSDLHQAGRQVGYGPASEEQRQLYEQQAIELGFDKRNDSKVSKQIMAALATGEQDYAQELVKVHVNELSPVLLSAVEGRNQELVTALQHVISRVPNLAARGDFTAALNNMAKEAGTVPASPWQKTWLRKVAEYHMKDAAENGLDYFAMPIKNLKRSSGTIGTRSAGVQEWYEGIVDPTLEAMARSAKLPYKKVIKGDTEYAVVQLRPDAEHIDRLVKGQLSKDDKYTKLRTMGLGSTAAKELADPELLAQKFAGYHPLSGQLLAGKSILSAASDGAIAKKDAKKRLMREGFTSNEVSDLLLGTRKLEEVVEAKRNAVAKIAGNAMSPEDKAEQLIKYGFSKAEAAELLTGAKTPQDAVKGWKAPDFSLYSAPTAGAVIAYNLAKEGYSQEEIDSALTEQGYDAEDKAEITKVAQAIATMRAEGYSMEEIAPLLEEQEAVPESVEQKPTGPVEPFGSGKFGNAYRALTGNDELSAKEMVKHLETVFPTMTSVTTDVVGFFGNQEAARATEEALTASRQRIINKASESGLMLNWNEQEKEWVVSTPNGDAVVTPELWRDLLASKGEITGGVAGAIAGYKMAKPASALPGPGKFLPFLAGAVGGIVGAVGGTELDYLHSAMVVQQDLEAEVAARKAMTAAEMGVIGEAVGAGVVKVAGSSWRGMKNAVEFVRNNSKDRAITALKDMFFITDQQATELVDRLATVSKPPIDTRSRVQKVISNMTGSAERDAQITALALTEPGGEALVKAAATIDPKASMAVAKSVADRAADVLQQTKSVAGDDVGRWVREDLEGYRSAVREHYEHVKKQAAMSPKLSTFKFNYDKLAIEPVLARLQKNIENKDLAFKFARQASRIRDMSASRRLPDLIELRKLVNDFRYNSRISKAKDYEMLDGIKAGIDKAIEQGAYQTMPDPKAWLKAWRETNAEYSQMKQLEDNALAKVLSRPGVSEKAIAQAMLKYSGSVDSTFVDVLAKLPKASRTKVEGAVLHELADKYTAGIEGGLRATHFPMLAQELKGVTFTTPEARKMKQALLKLSEVFRNDIPLAQATGRIDIPRFQSYLTTDPVVRAKFEVASTIFNLVRRLAPTAQGRATSLVHKAAELLEQPLHSKTIKELQAELADSPEVAAQLDKLAKETAKQQAAQGGLPRVKLYGDGTILQPKGVGKEHSIPMHRIATADVVNDIAERYGINRADKRALDHALREHGYSAAQLGTNKVRLLGE